MAIFNSYVKLPEGTVPFPNRLPVSVTSQGFKYADRVNATRVAFVAPGEWDQGQVGLSWPHGLYGVSMIVFVFT